LHFSRAFSTDTLGISTRKPTFSRTIPISEITLPEGNIPYEVYFEKYSPLKVRDADWQHQKTENKKDGRIKVVDFFHKGFCKGN